MTVTYVLSVVLQIAMLKTSPRYIWYITIALLQPIIAYIFCRFLAFRYYPYLKHKKKIEDEDKKDFTKLLGMAFHSMSAVIASYTDSFLISAFTGVASLGLYDNYRVIGTKVTALLDQVTSSIKDPMRSLLAENDKEHAETVLQNVTFVVFVVALNCSTLFVGLINPFVSIWIGDRFILDNSIVIVTGMNMFLASLNYILVDTYYYVRAFEKDKKSPIIEILVNLGFSFIFGLQMGITGVLLGTVLYYITQFILRGRRLYNLYFQKSYRNFFGQCATYVIVVLVSIIAFLKLSDFLMTRLNSFLTIGITGILILILDNLFVYILYRKGDRFLYCKEAVSSIVRRKKR